MPEKETYIRRQARKLSSGKIDRRRFVMSALATGVTLPTATTLAQRAEAAVPKSGGHFRYGVGFGHNDDVLDPARPGNHMVAAINLARGSCLTEIGSDERLVGALGKHFEPADGAKTWIIDLRSGVTFHSGKSLTADDVVATFERFRRVEPQGLLSQVSGIRKDGDRRVIIDLVSANHGFAHILADHRLIILPAEDGRVDGATLLGTGAYVLDRFEPGQRALLTRAPNHWRRDRGHFETVEFLSLPAAAERHSAIMNGDVDFIDMVDPRAVALLAQVPTLDILETEGDGYYGFPMRLDQAPFDSPDLRLALKYAIDRQDLVEKVLLGHGRPGNDLPFEASDLPIRPFDPERSAWHARASGFDSVIALSASDAGFPAAPTAARLMAATAARAGLAIEFDEKTDASAGWSAAFSRGRPTEDWTHAARPMPCGWLDAAKTSAFDRLMAAARAEARTDARDRCYRNARAILRDSGGLVIPMLANDIHAHAKTLAHAAHVGRHLRADGAKVAERWWFA